MGLTLDYFYSLTPRQFYNVLTGYRRKEFKYYKNGWEQTRQIMYTLLLPHQKKGSTLTPQKVMLLPWDNDNNTDTEKLDTALPSVEAIKAQQAEWAAIDALRAKQQREAPGTT